MDGTTKKICKIETVMEKKEDNKVKKKDARICSSQEDRKKKKKTGIREMTNINSRRGE